MRQVAVQPQPQPQPQPNHPDSDQVRRLQRELYRERWIMEKEQAVTALEAELANGGSESNGSLPKAPGSGERRRRSTNIGHRFGASRGPLVLKATLHQGDVNTRVSVSRMATRQQCGS